MVGQNVGKYKILDKIGRGGMGTVYRAIDETLHRDVAIKVLNAELNDPEVAKRFRAEAITVARLSHPGIATIYELFEHEGEWLMVMEFVRGETLESMVSRMGPLSAQRAAELCMQTLAALAHAHSMGVVHRDLKPANVMITENGAVKVMDFGIARVSGSEHLTNAGFMMGTPAYMAPEQVRGGEVDARADLYAMGVVFYRLTTSKLPFKGDTAFSMVQSQVNDPPTPALTFRHDLPGWVDEVVIRALEKAPEQRFQSAAEFHEAFARCLAGLPLSSMYGGDPMMTPSRAMPSGAFSRASMAQPTPFPGLTGAQPHQPMTTGSQPTMMSPSTHPGVIAGSGDPTMLTPSAAPAITGSMASPSVALAPVAAPKKSNLSLILAVAGVVVIAGSIGAWMLLQGGTPAAAPPPTDTPTTSTPPVGAPDQTAAGSPAVTTLPSPSVVPGPAVPQPTGTATTAASSSAAGIAPGATPVARNAGARAGATPTPTATPAATPAATASAAAANATTGAVATDPLATFPSVKIYVVDGKRATDRDVLLNFSGGQVMVMPKSGGEAIAAMPYKKILKATYAIARDPKWDTSLPGPPEGLDVGTFMRTTRHWLVVQGSEHFAVLRLDEGNARQILETFEARTGLKIARVK
jgi:serine/threonine protein kinase